MLLEPQYLSGKHMCDMHAGHQRHSATPNHNHMHAWKDFAKKQLLKQDAMGKMQFALFSSKSFMYDASDVCSSHSHAWQLSPHYGYAFSTNDLHLHCAPNPNSQKKAIPKAMQVNGSQCIHMHTRHTGSYQWPPAFMHERKC